LGSVPEWYRLITAARYLQVPPWELAQKPVWWTEIALAARAAESAAQTKKSGGTKGS